MPVYQSGCALYISRTATPAVPTCVATGRRGGCAPPGRDFVGRSAARQFEAGDAGLPAVAGRCARGAGGGVVLVDVPEGAVVDGVDVHRGVVTPAGVGAGLRRGAVDDGRLAEGHLAAPVTGEPAGVAD